MKYSVQVQNHTPHLAVMGLFCGFWVGINSVKSGIVKSARAKAEKSARAKVLPKQQSLILGRKRKLASFAGSVLARPISAMKVIDK